MESSIPDAGDADLDRQMLRHLMSRYSESQLARLMLEERGSPMIHNDAASIITNSTYSSVKSEDVPSMFDAASIRTFSSDNTSTRASIISNMSARTAKFLNRSKNHPGRSTVSIPSIETGEPASWEDGTMNGDAASISSASKQKSSFSCGFCKEEGIIKSCTRKNDLKRHIEDFHNMNALWSCRHRGCSMTFDWQTAYKTHLKQAHGGSRSSLDDVKVDLCPQTVFACGFENCPQIFEASSDADAGGVFKEYVGHIVKHFDEGSNSGDWTHTARIHNLLRQSGVLRAWNNSIPEMDRMKLDWNPQSSVVLRRRLETRHIGDLQLLIRHAVHLGSSPGLMSKPLDDFKLPTKDECRLPIQGHRNRLHSASATPEPDVQFKISRAADPTLQAYLASQRRVYVPRAPVRSGRSARPPSMTMSRHSQPSHPPPQPFSYQHNHSDPAMFTQHPQMTTQQYALMGQSPGGGIIADDIRNLRSMADAMSDGDVGMGDANMMDAAYMSPQSEYDGGYGQQLQSPSGSVDIGGQQHAFGAYSGAQQY